MIIWYLGIVLAWHCFKKNLGTKLGCVGVVPTGCRCGPRIFNDAFPLDWRDSLFVYLGEKYDL